MEPFIGKNVLFENAVSYFEIDMIKVNDAQTHLELQSDKVEFKIKKTFLQMGSFIEIQFSKFLFMRI